jgi:hypothetical protein
MISAPSLDIKISVGGGQARFPLIERGMKEKKNSRTHGKLIYTVE